MRMRSRTPEPFSLSRVVNYTILAIAVLVILYFALSNPPRNAARIAASQKERNLILVTGGSGFIGSNLVDYLLDQNYEVVVFNRNGLKVEAHKTHPRVHYYQGDIRNNTALELLPKNIYGVVHLAAAISVSESMTDPDKYRATNVDGSRNVFQWAANNGVRRIVSASSAAVYGDPKTLPCEESMPYAGISPYAESKFKMEEIQQEFAEKYNMDGAALRFFNVYGPRQDPKSPYSGVISKFLDQANSKKPIAIFGDGKNTRDFIFVKDIARAIVLVLTGTKRGFQVFNVGTGRATSLTELAQTVVKVVGAGGPLEYGPARAGDIVHSLSSPEKLFAAYGFRASVTLQEGLDITQKWFASL